MDIIAIKLKSDYAHFSHPATIYSSLTYPVPPKTSIMGFLGAIIGEVDYWKLSNFKYSVVVNKKIVKKKFVFNGIKSALSSSMNIKEGYQDCSGKKQFYRELICKPEYLIYLDLTNIEQNYKHKIIENLKNHKTIFTPYLGINFCIADFEFIEIKSCEQIKDEKFKINSFTTRDAFILDESDTDIRLTTCNFALDVEENRIFKNFNEMVVEISGNNKQITSKNNGNIFNIDDKGVYFV